MLGCAGLRKRGDRSSGGADRSAGVAEVRRVTGKEQIEICLEIRREVFVRGQGVSDALEVDGLDPECTHLLARLDGRSVGTARLRVVEGRAKAERVAVLEPLRGLGVGGRLMRAIEDEALRAGLDEIILDAQVAVIPFYEGLGYRAEGDVFIEAAIPHRRMRKGRLRSGRG